MDTGCVDEATLAELLGPEASASRRIAIQRHIDACGRCRALVATHGRTIHDRDSRLPESDDTIRSSSVPFAETIASDAVAATVRAPHGRLLAQRYLLERVIGEGGMGVVWAARDIVGDTRVALKIAKTGSPELAQRSWREARLAANLNHPSIVEPIDVLPQEGPNGAPILVLPLLEGESLDQLLARRGRLGEREALEILTPVVSAMRAAHALGVIHRDLKPANIFLLDGKRGARRVRVLDFGLAKMLSDDGTDEGADRLTRTGARLGTPYYMAPEQLMGDSTVDRRADVWAIGVVLYECIAGRHPIDGGSYAQLVRAVVRHPIAPLTSFVPGITPAVDTITLRMLSRERSERPSLNEVHGALRTSLERIARRP